MTAHRVKYLSVSDKKTPSAGFVAVLLRAFSRMTICSHQFHGGDGSDWVLSTSVGCLDGSTTASRILQELFKPGCRNLSTDTSGKCPKVVMASSADVSASKLNTKIKRTERFVPVKNEKEPEETLIVRKIPGISTLEYFDQSLHFNSCPMKWFHNKKFLEKNKRFKVQRLCSMRPPQKEEVKREKNNNLRDRTPVEVKIHKINLTEKYTINSDDLWSGETEGHSKNLDTHRKKLAAKLNWKLHDNFQDEFPYEISESGSKHNYFPPRPLLGLKPLLSILLAPHKTNCCCLVTHLRGTHPKRKGKGASLSIQSLNLPLPQPDQKSHSTTTNSLRWGSSKKLQIPNQITIKLDHKKQKCISEMQNNLKVIYYNPPAKRVNAERKQTKSLSSLFYELRGKTSHRAGQKDEVLEETIGDLAAEGKFQMKRFLNLETENADWGGGSKSTPGKKEKFVKESGGAHDSDLICGKIRFFKKILPKRSKRRSW